jgi:putative lipoic acid-binding regulatory protein
MRGKLRGIYIPRKRDRPLLFPVAGIVPDGRIRGVGGYNPLRPVHPCGAGADQSMPKKTALPSLYPCDFPIKVIGEYCLEFETGVLSVMTGELGVIPRENIGRNISSGGKYLSLTFRIVAQSREHLERLYAELNAQEKVIMVI